MSKSKPASVTALELSAAIGDQVWPLSLLREQTISRSPTDPLSGLFDSQAQIQWPARSVKMCGARSSLRPSVIAELLSGAGADHDAPPFRLRAKKMSESFPLGEPGAPVICQTAIHTPAPSVARSGTASWLVLSVAALVLTIAGGVSGTPKGLAA